MFGQGTLRVAPDLLDGAGVVGELGVVEAPGVVGVVEVAGGVVAVDVGAVEAVVPVAAEAPAIPAAAPPDASAPATIVAPSIREMRMGETSWGVVEWI